MGVRPNFRVLDWLTRPQSYDTSVTQERPIGGGSILPSAYISPFAV